MYRIEIELKGLVNEKDQYNGKFEIRLLRESGENSAEPNSKTDQFEFGIMKPLEQYLAKDFLPKMMEQAQKGLS